MAQSGDGLVMAMPMQHHTLAQSWRRVPGHLRSQKIRQKKCLSRQVPRVRIIWKEVHELVAEDRVAAWLENDEWCACLDVRPQRVEAFSQQAFGLREKSIIVERSAAAQRSSWQGDITASGFEHFGGGDSGVRMEMVVERIRPEQHLPGARPRACPMCGPRTKPLYERAVGEFRLIRPLVYVTEDITTAFAQYLGAPLVPCDCSLRTGTVRRSLRGIFSELEQEFPHLKENILSAMGNLDTGRLLDTRYLELEDAEPAKQPFPIVGDS